MDKQKVIEKIEQAFDNSTYPGDENIVYKTQYDDEVAECEKKFLGKKWQEVDPQSIKNEGYASGCAFLTNDAYRYYIPAYMISILKQPREMFEAIDVVVQSLTLPEDLGKDRFLERVGGFSNDQGEAIKQFLQSLYETLPQEFYDKEPLVAIEKYWKKF